MTKVKVASLNTFGLPFLLGNLRTRYQAIASYFNSSDVDVILLQEIMTYGHFFLMKKHLNTYKYICYEKSYIGPKGGLVIFSRSPLQFKSYLTYPKRFSRWDLSLIDVLTFKGILIAQLKDRDILLLNTHLNAVFDTNWTPYGKYYKTLKSQIEFFNKKLFGLRNAHTSVVACGDFNTERSSGLQKNLIKGTVFSDVFFSKPRPTHRTTFFMRSKDYCIDYIFFNGNKRYSLISKSYLFTEKMHLGKNRMGFVSDHIGLMIVLKNKSKYARS